MLLGPLFLPALLIGGTELALLNNDFPVNEEQAFRRDMRCSFQAFGSKASFVAFDALATPVPTACGDRLFFNSKKKEASGVQLPSSSKMPLSKAEGLAQRKSLL